MTYFVDVREPEEFNSGHIENAINIPLNEIETSDVLTSIPKDSEIIVYCRSGIRAGKAQKVLFDIGYTNVTNGLSKEMIKLFHNKSII